ncbi:hypothetical protein FACS18947_5150 [Bacteroidia bacterium]|nr:hypothetical protein FACS18947_5150 [Bacteroidia bacterium]
MGTKQQKINRLSVNVMFRKKFSAAYFKDKYLHSYLNFSIHGFLLYQEQIVGMFSIIPRLYHFNSEHKIIGLGCDAFILPKHRKDDFFLKEMADAAYEICKKNNINYLISIPNPTAYPYWKYYGNWCDIGALDYYILPYKISKLIKVCEFFDVFSSVFFKIVNACSLWISSFGKDKSTDKKISLVKDERFLEERYNKSDNYKIYKIDKQGYFVARQHDEDGVCTVYLVDCHPLTNNMIKKALYRIIKDFSFDVILFVGKLESHPFYFIKVPKSKEPRIQPFTCYLLTDKQKDDFLSIASWNIGLADFDNR